MSTGNPHYLLFSEFRPAASAAVTSPGKWHFVLESLSDGHSFEAASEEPAASPEQLELLAVVRGLEALDQPSRVTLITTSRYVARGLRHGLEQWRENQFQWEWFGRLVPINHRDLWRRIDQALAYHKVECRLWSAEYDASHELQSADAETTNSDQIKLFAPLERGRRVARAAASCLLRWLTKQDETGVAAAA